MGRKVLISFLGTNNYLQTRYSLNGEVYKPTRFIQEILADIIFSQFSSNDKILVFYTKKSMECNWLNDGQPRTLENSQIENIGLKQILESKDYGAIVEGYKISEGFSEKEVWDIFDAVYSKLEQDDEIYFDVTHAFRSIPMFSTILFNYAQLMNGVKLCNVYYGAFEKLGPAFEVMTTPVEERIAPILDLKTIIQLQSLTQIAQDFISYGRVGKLADTFSPGDNKRQNNLIGQFKSEISKLESYIVTNKIKDIEEGKFVSRINQIVKQLDELSSITEAQRTILHKLKDNVGAFKENGGFQNILAAYDWSLRYDMIHNAYILATESVITATLNCIKEELVIFDKELSKRNFVSSLLNISSSDKKNRKYEKELAIDYELTDRMFEKEIIHNLRKPFATIAKNRNELCHGKQSDLSLDKYKSQLVKNFEECKQYLKIQ